VKRHALALVALLLLTATSCTDDANGSADPNQRLIDIYAVAIQTVAVHERPDFSGQDELDVVVYVAGREGVDIALDVQLGVVLALEDWASIRFIDEFDEAIASGEPDQPVRDGGVLIGLGDVPDGTASVELIADRYERAGQLMAFDLTLRRRSGEWSVVEPVEGTRVTLR
jgi:hypothetical protein